ncbi:MAG: ankyrin repeat domain-containing protein, partial [Candidatus Adiutrix sp.]|nr:ankyrin repeat domain-containing protein [Candidatus Adiutrix sp.]
MKRILTTAVLFFLAFMAAQQASAQRVDPGTILARQTTVDQGLFFALARGDVNTMTVYRDQGADPNISLTILGLKAREIFGKDQPIFKAPFDPSGWPILTWAVYLDNEEAVKLLLRSGARVNAPDVYGATALHWAAWAGQHTVAKILLNNGANCLA